LVGAISLYKHSKLFHQENSELWVSEIQLGENIKLRLLH
jgi:hypothetical protein